MMSATYTPISFRHCHVEVPVCYAKTSPRYEGPHDSFLVYPSAVEDDMVITTRHWVAADTAEMIARIARMKSCPIR